MKAKSQQQQQQQQHIPVTLLAITQSNPSNKGKRMKSSCLSRQSIMYAEHCCWQRILRKCRVHLFYCDMFKSNLFMLRNGCQKQFSPIVSVESSSSKVNTEKTLNYFICLPSRIFFGGVK